MRHEDACHADVHDSPCAAAGKPACFVTYNKCMDPAKRMTARFKCGVAFYFLAHGCCEADVVGDVASLGRSGRLESCRLHDTPAVTDIMCRWPRIVLRVSPVLPQVRAGRHPAWHGTCLEWRPVSSVDTQCVVGYSRLLVVSV